MPWWGWAESGPAFQQTKIETEAKLGQCPRRNKYFEAQSAHTECSQESAGVHGCEPDAVRGERQVIYLGQIVEARNAESAHAIQSVLHYYRASAAFTEFTHALARYWTSETLEIAKTGEERVELAKTTLRCPYGDHGR